MRAFGASSASTSCGRVSVDPMRDRSGPTSLPRPRMVWHRVHSAAGLSVTTRWPLRKSPPLLSASAKACTSVSAFFAVRYVSRPLASASEPSAWTASSRSTCSSAGSVPALSWST